MLDTYLIHVLKTEQYQPLVALMNEHSGSYNIWELARLIRILQRPSILIRQDAHDDLIGINEERLVDQPNKISETSPRYGNQTYTVPALYYGLIDEIYFIPRDIQFYASFADTYEAILFEAEDITTGKKCIELTFPPGIKFEHYKSIYKNIKPIRKIKVHIVTNPDQMPDLSRDKRQVLWDVDADWYFTEGRGKVERVRQRLMRSKDYLSRINRVPDVFTFALSSEITGQTLEIENSCHAEFLMGWLNTIRDMGVEFICDRDGVPNSTTIEEVLASRGSPAANEASMAIEPLLKNVWRDCEEYQGSLENLDDA